MAIIAQASNLQSVTLNGRSNVIPNVTNWTNPDAPYNGDDYWVDTVKNQPVLRPWDMFTLGGSGKNLPFPGLWKLAPKVGIGFDVTKRLLNPGGASQNPPQPPKFKITLTPKGYNPATITATGEIWTANDWQTLKSYLPQISPKKGETAQPIAWNLVHPGCNLLGIDQVIVTEVGLPEVIDQTLTIQISLLQYFPQGQIFKNPYGNVRNTNFSGKSAANANVQTK